MGTVYGSIDAGRDSCVLLYDVFGNSYAGEPTINLFYQPPGFVQYSGTYYNSDSYCGGGKYRTFIHTQNPVLFPAGSQKITGYVEFTKTSGSTDQVSAGRLTLNTSGFSDFYYCDSADSSAGNAKISYEGFGITPFYSNTGRSFYKLNYSENLNGQGNFFDNAPGPYLQTDSIYKYNFTGTQTDSFSNKHGFTINIVRGETYSIATDIYVSTGHPRTGSFPVVSLTPNLTGSFATITGSYDANRKGTWQNFKQKVYVPSSSDRVVNFANYYEVSVSAKTALHPYYGTGSSDSFKIGTGESPTLNLYKGYSYIFSQTNSSNLDDQIYLSTIPNAGGESNSYTNGFSYYGNRGFDGYAAFTVPYNAPLLLYYNSMKVGSSYFGGKINILGSYSVGNVGNVGNGGCGGNGGNVGSSVTTESYAVCFDPTRSELSAPNLSGGYILYRNMQFEKNKPMFRGIIHPTKFTSSSRTAYNSLLDLTARNNNANLTHAMFDSDSFILFGNKTNSSNGGVIDINLKYNTSKTFSIGSSTTQSYDFWFKQTAASFKAAYLFSRSSGVSRNLFVESQGFPQLIFVQGKEIYFSFASPNGKILYGYSDGVIELNTLYNVVITVNAQFATDLKVDVYLNGRITTVIVLTALEFPSKFLATSSAAPAGNVGNVGNVGTFNNNTNFYCISSYSSNGESKASPTISSTNSQLRKSTKLTWEIVDQAIGYYIYRSNSPSFGDYSLIANITNQDTLNFTDDNFQTKLGKPKNFSNFVYDADVVTLTDDLDAKTCFGDYPTTTLIPSYFEGYIYRIAIYKTKLTSTQVYKNYNSFLYKYISESPATIASPVKQRSVIYKRVRN